MCMYVRIHTYHMTCMYVCVVLVFLMWPLVRVTLDPLLIFYTAVSTFFVPIQF